MATFANLEDLPRLDGFRADTVFKSFGQTGYDASSAKYEQRKIAGSATVDNAAHFTRIRSVFSGLRALSKMMFSNGTRD